MNTFGILSFDCLVLEPSRVNSFWVWWPEPGQRRCRGRSGSGSGRWWATVSHRANCCGIVDEHMRSLVLKERPHQCDVCQMRFTQSSSLGRHKKIHTGKVASLPSLYLIPTYHTLPYAINLLNTTSEWQACGLWLSCCWNEPNVPGLILGWFGLEEHRRALLAKERPYQCEVCYVRFTQKSSLGRHGKIHTGGCKQDNLLGILNVRKILRQNGRVYWVICQ